MARSDVGLSKTAVGPWFKSERAHSREVNKMKKHKKRDASSEPKKEKKQVIKASFKAWNRDIAIVTFVGILMLLFITGFMGMLIAQLSASIDTLNQKIDTPSVGDTANTIMAATGETDICTIACNINSNKEIVIPVESSGEDLCSVDGELSVLVFHSPTCPYCSEQTPSLDMLEEKYGDKLNIEYACFAIHEGDDALCAASPEDWDYQAEDAMILAQKYGARATPTLVFDCGLSRVGSLAVRDGAEAEKEDIDKIVSNLLS